ncbi:uncharacterized protein LOC128437216 [Pleuronectes platessa]|uniref:uncharacterized protein LOC128437216 n=1 Tax=Pleuronectes platessa TaxID=8262 RepID=UPI00232A2071|nr:uncharacterized protein LOC128437216 [Pleuronectes platessa]
MSEEETQGDDPPNPTMSTGDFQTRYASVMESMLKSSIAETTTLFETIVDELKAEISGIKKENEDLRARCSQFEERPSTVGPAPPQPCSERRDTAVQCDLVPLRTMLVEQCQSLEYSSLQIEQQQCCQWEMENSLQDHNYGNADSQMTLTLVKEEESYDGSSLLPVIKQEDEEPNTSCCKVTNEGSERTTACGNENEGPHIDHTCSTGEMFENDEETRVTLELRCHGMDNDLERAQNQPSEPEPPLVFTVKCDMQDKTEGQLVTSEEQTFVTAQQQSMVELQKEQLSGVPQQCHREGEMSISEQTDATVQQYANVQCTEEHVTSESAAPVTPNKLKIINPSALQRTMESAVEDVENSELGSLPFTVESLTRGCSSYREKTSGSQQCPMEMEAPPTENSSATETLNSPPAETPQASPVERRERCSSVTLQDAMLLVEAMNRSAGEHSLSSFKGMRESPQTQYVPHMDTLQTMDKVPAKPQTLPLSSETCEAAGSPAITLLSTTQSTVQTLSTSPQVTDSHSTNKPKPQIKIVIQNPLVTASNIATQQLSSSTCETQTSEQSQQQFPRPVIRWVITSKPSKANPNNIIVVQRPESLLMPYQFAALPPTQPPTLVSIIAKQNNSLLSSSTERPSSCSLPEKTEASMKSVPVVPLNLTATSTDTKSGFLPLTKFPRQVSDVASGTHQSPLEQKLSAVVRLFRLPIAVSTKESVLVSKLLSYGFHERQLEMHVTSPNICPSLKETANSVSFNTSQFTKEKNNNQDMYHSKYVPPPTPPKVSASLFDISTEAISKPSAVEPISNLEKEIFSNAMQDCARSNDAPITEKRSANLIQLISIPSKDGSHPHLQMSQTQFLAQLAVLPVVQAPQKASSNDVADTPASSAETSTKGKNTLMARLRRHLKTHLPTRRSETKPYPCTETEITTVSPKKHRLQNDNPNNTNTTTEHISVKPKESGFVEDVASRNKAANDSIPNSPRTGLCRDPRPKRSVSEPTRRSEPKSETTAKRGRRSSSGKVSVCSNNVEGSSVTHGRPSSTKDGANPRQTQGGVTLQNTKSTTRRISSSKGGATLKQTKRTGLCRDPRPKRSVSEPTRRSEPNGETTPKRVRRSSSGKVSVCSNNVKGSSVTHGRPSSTKDGTNPRQTEGGVTLKITKPTTRRISSSKGGATLKQTKSSSVRAKRSPSTRQQSSLKKTESSAASPQKSDLCDSVAKVKMSTSEMTAVSQWSPVTQHSSSTRQFKKESSPLILWRKTTDIAGPKSQSGSSSVCCPKLAKDGVSPGKTVETTPAKKARLIQEVTKPEKNLSGLNANNLAKAAKATRSAKIKNSYQSKLQNAGKRSLLTDKAYKTTAVWTPTTIPASETPVINNQCGECGRILSSSAALESHVSLHRGSRPFSCTLCEKTFPDAKGLSRHSQVHSNGKIHICKICKKGFDYSFTLTKHVQMVHEKIKPFVCQICNKRFFIKQHMEDHIRKTHTGEKPFQCDLCEKRFSRKVELDVHLRWHRGEKRHCCSYCGKAFLDQNNLKRHKFIHTGEKPHSCPHCPKHFTQSGHLKKHVKNIHKIT